MPEALWAHAVECARNHGVETVAARLRVRPATLLRRLGGEKADTESKKPVFVEVGMASPSQGVQIEVDRPDGAKLTVHLQAQGADLPGLVSAFLSRSS
jgi:hypothetical protein